jgi:hypothetical protein
MNLFVQSFGSRKDARSKERMSKFEHTKVENGFARNASLFLLNVDFCTSFFLCASAPPRLCVNGCFA